MIKKSIFYKYKKLFKRDDIDANKKLVSEKNSNKSNKYFIWYNECDIIRPLCMILPQMIGYLRYFGSNEAMFFRVSDKKNCKKRILKYGRKLVT